MKQIKEEMKNYKFKKTDVKMGNLISPDRHVRSVQERFMSFRQIVGEITRVFLDEQIEKFKKALTICDELNRNPLHYAALSKFTKCSQTAEYLLNFSLNITGYDDF